MTCHLWPINADFPILTLTWCFTSPCSSRITPWRRRCRSISTQAAHCARIRLDSTLQRFSRLAVLIIETEIWPGRRYNRINPHSITTDIETEYLFDLSQIHPGHRTGMLEAIEQFDGVWRLGFHPLFTSVTLGTPFFFLSSLNSQSILPCESHIIVKTQKRTKWTIPSDLTDRKIDMLFSWNRKDAISADLQKNGRGIYQSLDL